APLTSRCHVRSAGLLDAGCAAMRAFPCVALAIVSLACRSRPSGALDGDARAPAADARAPPADAPSSAADAPSSAADAARDAAIDTPIVLATIPEDGVDHAPRDVAITARFSADMDPASILDAFAVTRD